MEHAYRELPPPASLSAYLRCFWVETTGDRQDAGTMRVLPDGCIDLIWVTGRQPHIVGTATQAAFPLIPPGTTLVGARFEPGMVAGLLGAPADVLANLDVPVADLWGHGAAVDAGIFNETGAPTAGLAGLRTLLTDRLRQVDGAGDPPVRATAEALVRDPGTSLDVLVDRSGLSERQLRRRFEAAIGYGPKTFQRVMRFRQWLDLATTVSPAERSLTDLAALAGYADQAHLTREVTRLAGLPPTALLATHQDTAS